MIYPRVTSLVKYLSTRYNYLADCALKSKHSSAMPAADISIYHRLSSKMFCSLHNLSLYDRCSSRLICLCLWRSWRVLSKTSLAVRNIVRKCWTHWVVLAVRRCASGTRGAMGTGLGQWAFSYATCLRWCMLASRLRMGSWCGFRGGGGGGR